MSSCEACNRIPNGPCKRCKAEQKAIDKKVREAHDDFVQINIRVLKDSASDLNNSMKTLQEMIDMKTLQETIDTCIKTLKDASQEVRESHINQGASAEHEIEKLKLELRMQEMRLNQEQVKLEKKKEKARYEVEVETLKLAQEKEKTKQEQIKRGLYCVPQVRKEFNSASSIDEVTGSNENFSDGSAHSSIEVTGQN